ncbi:cytochrome-c oxidase, cbb3-type subunit III [Salinarimonas chemoclinalis]|uniref:cytochrome-c oxidase, cbb3-type subunit III n=1 Tax=Salinarimonas chemoclinalis TaxID=3241599 RepID=UPI0035589CF2
MAQNKQNIDKVTGVSTTGHEWDGITELNNPLPRWWLYIFYATIAWSFLYVLLYPAIPLVNSATGGILGWNSRSAVVGDLERLDASRGGDIAALRDVELASIEENPQLLAFAQAYGRAAFGDNCSACHGAGGGGAVGFPNLVDDDWLWGGTLEAIQHTITYGIRSTPMDTRFGDMPAFVRDGWFGREDALVLTDYVRHIAGLETPAGFDPAAGAELFAVNCAACHGEAGEGIQDMGAPNLTDGIWLYGSDRDVILEGLVNGRAGMMPHFGERLDEATVKALAVYVHTLGGGE